MTRDDCFVGVTGISNRSAYRVEKDGERRNVKEKRGAVKRLCAVAASFEVSYLQGDEFFFACVCTRDEFGRTFGAQGRGVVARDEAAAAVPVSEQTCSC